MCGAVPDAQIVWSCWRAAIGRLEDESQLVVKAALQLLGSMLRAEVFPPELNAQVCVRVSLRLRVLVCVCVGGGHLCQLEGQMQGLGLTNEQSHHYPK